MSTVRAAITRALTEIDSNRRSRLGMTVTPSLVSGRHYAPGFGRTGGGIVANYGIARALRVGAALTVKWRIRSIQYWPDHSILRARYEIGRLRAFVMRSNP